MPTLCRACSGDEPQARSAIPSFGCLSSRFALPRAVVSVGAASALHVVSASVVIRCVSFALCLHERLS